MKIKRVGINSNNKIIDVDMIEKENLETTDKIITMLNKKVSKLKMFILSFIVKSVAKKIVLGKGLLHTL